MVIITENSCATKDVLPEVDIMYIVCRIREKNPVNVVYNIS